MASDYDIVEAFKAIEDELTSSMIRNLDRHRAEETKEGFEWSMWQVEQLKSLEKYKKDNQKKYANQFKNINAQIEAMIYAAKEQGGTEQELQILRAMKKGLVTQKATRGATAEFFKPNERKLDALVKATTQDMERAEIAVLRRANDQYRKIIYNAQVYANTGAGTYEKAVDMATKDFLKSGISCIEYANGSRHTIADYSRMAIRTASKRAYLQGEGEKRKEWGIYTVIINKRGNACPLCLPYCGKVYIDDVWSDGPKDGKSPVTGTKYPLLSTAIAGGLYHPNCKDSHTTYFEGISTPPTGSKYTREELKQMEQEYKAEQRQQYAERQEEKYDRLAKYSLDEENQRKYAARREEWKKKHASSSTAEVSDKTIVFDMKGKEAKFERSTDLIKQLSEEYTTRLQKVTVGAEKAAGATDIAGAKIRLSASDPRTAIHEFAHTLTNSKASKYGIVHDDDFWKEIKSVKRKYRKDVGDDIERWISEYEHSTKDIDEFFAEAFTQAKMRELGIDMPSQYGADFTYSQQVLDITNKYFGKSVAKSVDSDIIKADKVISGHSGTPKQFEAGGVIDHLGDDGKVETRTYYGSDSFKAKDITNHDHGNPKQHPYGEHGEHAHDYVWDKEGKLKKRTTREIKDDERKENGDML